MTTPDKAEDVVPGTIDEATSVGRLGASYHSVNSQPRFVEAFKWNDGIAGDGTMAVIYAHTFEIKKSNIPVYLNEEQVEHLIFNLVNILEKHREKEVE